MSQPKMSPRRIRKAPISGNDDFNEWRERQPAITVTDADGVFPSGDEKPPENLREFDEKAPKIPSPLSVRAKGLRSKIKDALAKPSTGRKTVRPRVSVENIISSAWGLLSQFVAPVNPVVSRVFAVQAPVAGMVLEDSVKNTVIDRVLQPIARLGSGGEVVFALFGPPILMAYLAKQNNILQTETDEKKLVECQRKMALVTPILRQSMRSWITLAGPKLEILAQQEQEFEKKYGADIDRMINFFLTGELPQTP